MAIVCCLLSFQSCRLSRYVPEGDHLHEGSIVKLESRYKITDRDALESELLEVLRPKPNNKLFGMRLGLWANYKVKNGSKNPLIKRINNKRGEPAVLASEVNVENNSRLLINRLENNGFFNAEISVDRKYKKNKATVNYTIRLSEPYTISSYEYQAQQDDELSTVIENNLDEKSHIAIGDRFSFSKLKLEKERIAQNLKDEGFYNFQADYLLFRADSSRSESHSIALRLLIKPETPQEALLKYRISEVIVFPNFALKEDTVVTDTSYVKGIAFVQQELFFKPDKLHPYLLMREGDLYNQANERITSRRLSGLNTYRFVNIRYEKDELKTSDSLGYLNASIQLSPAKKMSLSAELQGLSKSNNFIGPALIFNYRNRNMFKGGELLNIRAKAAYETQLSGSQNTPLRSFEWGLKGDLVYPRLLSPFNLGERFRQSIPTTKISLSYDYFNRVQLFNLNSLLGTFGYEWAVNRYVNHNLNPVSINFIDLGRTTDDFENILEANPFLRLSFQQQFIAGMTYSFQYSQLVDQNRKSRLFFLFNADLAGNTFGVLHRIVDPSSETNTIWGQNYAQFAKFDVDLRNYLSTSKNSRLISRIYAGLGLPYGNSNALPYVKQFFAGGPNSIRAFRIRALGPGSYQPETISAGSFFDQAGDIKLEANLEYRFPLVSYLKGALFVDAGNIWLQNENPSLPGAAFSKDWVQQIAIGSGVGIRLDIDFFVLRLDVATPLRKPVDGTFQWQERFSIGKHSWRRQNLIWNFGIGYPF